MSIIAMEMRPGLGLGPFKLGMSFSEAFAIAEQQQNHFKHIDIKYCDQDYLEWDIVLSLPRLGFHLLFCPHSQRLRLIEVYDLQRMQIKYGKSLFGGPVSPATFNRVYSVLGPTSPGKLNEKRQTYSLIYPGLSLVFPVASQYLNQYRQKQGEEGPCFRGDHFSSHFGDASACIATRVQIFSSSPSFTCQIQPQNKFRTPNPNLNLNPNISSNLNQNPNPNSNQNPNMNLNLNPNQNQSLNQNLNLKPSLNLNPPLNSKSNPNLNANPNLNPNPNLSQQRNSITNQVQSKGMAGENAESPHSSCPNQQDSPRSLSPSPTSSSSSSSSIPCPSCSPAPPPPLPPSSLYMEPVHAKLGEGIFLEFSEKFVFFGDSIQDVLMNFGNPCKIFQKQADPMCIHSQKEDQNSYFANADYFYTYFSKGMDVLFDGRKHKVKKFVFHTNFPGYVDFNVYSKCNFYINYSNENDKCKEMVKNVINADTKWDMIEDIFGTGEKAIIQSHGIVGSSFGPTLLHCYRNISFEMMKNGHIATVTLFQ